ncbi:MAG TPA: hypothetical protein VMY77_01320 [Chitinophagaceae bacterium]|nr:hypothetical protein [Chitinophagaceae bacterium]
MVSKLIIATAITFIVSLQLVAQTDEVNVSVNGKKIGKISVAKDPAVITVNKIQYKKIPNLTVTIKQSSVNRIYKRTLQVTDENESLLFNVAEQRAKIGLYKIDLTKKRQLLLKQNIIKVFLAEDPPNPMMRIPSKRKLLAEIHLK